MQKTSLREEIYGYVRKKYKSEIEQLWVRFPSYAVFRHRDNGKWYGLVMDIPRAKLGLQGEGSVDVLDVKMDSPLLADLLTREEGCLPGYHISRGSWISVLLDGSVPLARVCELLDRSYAATASAKTRQALRTPKEWLVPANPAYYDIEHAFDAAREIVWKQGRGIRKGDTVFLYAGAPVSAILYRCRVTGTDIPCSFRKKELNIPALMRLRLEKRVDPARFPFSLLRTHYGVTAVRGPRGIPALLSEDLKLFSEGKTSRSLS